MIVGFKAKVRRMWRAIRAGRLFVDDENWFDVRRGFSINEGFDFRRRFPWLNGTICVLWPGSNPFYSLYFVRVAVAWADHYLLDWNWRVRR